jgi:FlaG/FlaF family flagellin (archaellin)
MKRFTMVVIAVAVLLAAALACSDVGGSSSLITSRSSTGDSGRVEIKGSADGTSTGEIEIAQNFPGAWVDLEVAASVDSGQYTIEFLNDAGYSVLSLDVKSGDPARESVPVTLDDDGAVPYTLTASDAEGIHLVVSFKIR